MKVVNCMVDWLEFSVFDLSKDEVLSALDLKEFKFEQIRCRWYKDNMSFENMITISTGFYGKVKDDTCPC